MLASASPRRHRLLGETGLRFEVDPADADESFAPPASLDEVERVPVDLAARKARLVAARHPEAWVLGADTIVAVGADASWDVLGKPEDEREASEMLATLSSSRHAVVTGLCVLAPDGRAHRGHETTWVTMRRITPDEVAAYVASGEWRGKAGGYAIQETADAFVTGLEGGGFDNVVGLPVARTLELLAEAGAPGVAGARGHR